MMNQKLIAQDVKQENFWKKTMTERALLAAQIILIVDIPWTISQYYQVQNNVQAEEVSL